MARPFAGIHRTASVWMFLASIGLGSRTRFSDRELDQDVMNRIIRREVQLEHLSGRRHPEAQEEVSRQQSLLSPVQMLSMLLLAIRGADAFMFDRTLARGSDRLSRRRFLGHPSMISSGVVRGEIRVDRAVASAIAMTESEKVEAELSAAVQNCSDAEALVEQKQSRLQTLESALEVKSFDLEEIQQQLREAQVKLTEARANEALIEAKLRETREADAAVEAQLPSAGGSSKIAVPKVHTPGPRTAGAPPPDDLADEVMLSIVKQEMSDSDVNELVWKYLGYRRDEESGKWDASGVFPKWAQKYPEPPDLVGVTRTYSKEVDEPVLRAVQSLQRSVPREHKDNLRAFLSRLGWRGFKMAGLTPNMTRRAQVSNWLFYYREALHGVSLEELRRRREVRAAQEAADEENAKARGESQATGTTKQGVI